MEITETCSEFLQLCPIGSEFFPLRDVVWENNNSTLGGLSFMPTIVMTHVTT